MEGSEPSSGSSIPINGSDNPTMDMGREAEGDGSIDGRYQTAREDSATVETGQTADQHGETASVGQTCSKPEVMEEGNDTDTSWKRKSKPRRKPDVMAKIGQTVKTIYGQLELQLLELDDQAIEEEDRVGWADAHRHRVARAF